MTIQAIQLSILLLLFLFFYYSRAFIIPITPGRCIYAPEIADP
jgi:hypothetical protein